MTQRSTIQTAKAQYDEYLKRLPMMTPEQIREAGERGARIHDQMMDEAADAFPSAPSEMQTHSKKQ